MQNFGSLKLISQIHQEVEYLIHSAEDSVIVKVAETDFINCNYGVNLSKGVESHYSIVYGWVLQWSSRRHCYYL